MTLIKCKYCLYMTDRKYNLDRHYIKMHSDKNKIIENNITNKDNITNESNKLYCKKCYKEYYNNKYLLDHEKDCDGIDSLTCSKCMTTFAHRQSKYNHLKRNNCKAKSKIHYNNPNLANIVNTNSYNNSYNTNNTNCNNTYNIYINDFGKERTDYITVENLVSILKSNNIIPSYIDAKHFNVDFPENHNIKFEKNICYVKKQDKWHKIGIDKLSTTLLRNNTHEIASKYNNTRDIIENIIKNVDMIEYIEKKFNYLDLITNKSKYTEALNDIKFLIKNK